MEAMHRGLKSTGGLLHSSLVTAPLAAVVDRTNCEAWSRLHDPCLARCHAR